MLISGNAGAHEDDRLEKADEIIHKSAVLLQKKMRRTRLRQVRYPGVGVLNVRRGRE